MKSVGIVRKVDELGRIVIPVELRRKFGIDIKDLCLLVVIHPRHISAVWLPLLIYTEDNCIILKKYEPSCIFCGDAKNIFQFNGKNICPECAKKINGYVAE